MRDDRQRLTDILEAIDRIETYSSKGRAAFDRDELIQVWILHHLEILGEAARGISKELRQRHTEIPWEQIIGMRNILIHAYFDIRLERVWMTVERDLPPLKERIQKILAGPG